MLLSENGPTDDFIPVGVGAGRAQPPCHQRRGGGVIARYAAAA